jgi:hypothetical protein
MGSEQQRVDGQDSADFDALGRVPLDPRFVDRVSLAAKRPQADRSSDRA